MLDSAAILQEAGDRVRREYGAPSASGGKS